MSCHVWQRRTMALEEYVERENARQAKLAVTTMAFINHLTETVQALTVERDAAVQRAETAESALTKAQAWFWLKYECDFHRDLTDVEAEVWDKTYLEMHHLLKVASPAEEEGE